MSKTSTMWDYTRAPWTDQDVTELTGFLTDDQWAEAFEGDNEHALDAVLEALAADRSEPERAQAAMMYRLNRGMEHYSQRGQYIEKHVHDLEDRAEAQRIFLSNQSNFGAFDDSQVVSIWDMTDGSEGEWLVDGIVPKYGTTMLYAEGFAGKSYVSLALAASIASGTPWFGRDVEQGKVLYLALEGQGTIHKRVLAWTQENGVDPSTLNDTFVVRPGGLNLLDREFAEGLAKYVRDNDITFVVLDTLAKSLGAGDPTKDAGTLMVNIAIIQEATKDGGFLYVHHSKKDDKAVHRDSSRYFDDVDQVLRLMLGEAGNPANPLRELTVMKNKTDTSAALETIAFEFATAGPDSVLRLTSLPDTNELDRFVKSTLRVAEGALTKDELFEVYTGSKSIATLANRLTIMTSSGALTAEKRGQANAYRLA